MKQRLDKLDLIRAIAALAVVLIHVSGQFVTVSRTAYLLNQLMRFAVPIFIILSGFLLYHSDKDKGAISLKRFYFGRFKKVLIPYIIWTFVYAFVNTRDIKLFVDPWYWLNSLAFAKASFHLYFIIIILQLYLVYPLLRFLVSKYEKATLLISFLITFYYQLQTYLNTQGIDIPTYKLFFPSYMSILTWAFYFVLGMWLAKHAEKFNNIKAKSTIAALVAWGGSFVLLLIDNHYTNSYELSIKPTIILYSSTSTVLIYMICIYIERFSRVVSMLKWIALQSMFIYFVHPIFMDIITRNLSLTFSPLPKMACVFAVTSTLSILTALIASKIPLGVALGTTTAKKS